MANKQETEPTPAAESVGSTPADSTISNPGDGSERIAPRPADGRFRKGQSGNPKGRPPGSRNAMSLLVEGLLEGEADAIMRAVIEQAKKGEPAAQRLCLERMLPVKRERVVTIDLPPINCPADAKRAMAAIIGAVAQGDLSASEASQISEMINAYLKAWGATDLADRLDQVEQFMRTKQ
jgi:Family of unknown function (DUF5681)